MKNIQFATDDGFRFKKVGDVISISGMIGGYRKLGEGEEFYYYSDLIDITQLQRLEFENRVRQLIACTDALERNIK